MTPRQKLILEGIRADAAEIAGMPWDIPGSSQRLGAHRLKVTDAKAGWVPPNLPGWLGYEPSASEGVMASRDYRVLEVAGLVELRLGLSGKRITAMRLTAAGVAAVERFEAGDAADLGAGI